MFAGFGVAGLGGMVARVSTTSHHRACMENKVRKAILSMSEALKRCVRQESISLASRISEAEKWCHFNHDAPDGMIEMRIPDS